MKFKVTRKPVKPEDYPKQGYELTLRSMFGDADGYATNVWRIDLDDPYSKFEVCVLYSIANHGGYLDLRDSEDLEKYVKQNNIEIPEDFDIHDWACDTIGTDASNDNQTLAAVDSVSMVWHDGVGGIAECTVELT